MSHSRAGWVFQQTLRNLSFTKGDIVSNGAADTIHSNRLLYRNPTLPGMSGGAILNAQGELIGIHLNAVRADQISDSSGKAVAIQINQGLAIDAYTQSTASTTAQAVATQPAVSSVRPATGWPETAAPPLPLAPSLTSLTPRRSPAPPARMSQSLMERYQEAVEAQRLFIKSLTGR